MSFCQQLIYAACDAEREIKIIARSSEKLLITEDDLKDQLIPQSVCFLLTIRHDSDINLFLLNRPISSNQEDSPESLVHVSSQPGSVPQSSAPPIPIKPITVVATCLKYSIENQTWIVLGKNDFFDDIRVAPHNVHSITIGESFQVHFNMPEAPPPIGGVGNDTSLQGQRSMKPLISFNFHGELGLTQNSLNVVTFNTPSLNLVGIVFSDTSDNKQFSAKVEEIMKRVIAKEKREKEVMKQSFKRRVTMFSEEAIEMSKSMKLTQPKMSPPSFPPTNPSNPPPSHPPTPQRAPPGPAPSTPQNPSPFAPKLPASSPPPATPKTTLQLKSRAPQPGVGDVRSPPFTQTSPLSSQSQNLPSSLPKTVLPPGAPSIANNPFLQKDIQKNDPPQNQTSTGIASPKPLPKTFPKPGANPLASPPTGGPSNASPDKSRSVSISDRIKQFNQSNPPTSTPPPGPPQRPPPTLPPTLPKAGRSWNRSQTVTASDSMVANLRKENQETPKNEPGNPLVRSESDAPTRLHEKSPIENSQVNDARLKEDEKNRKEMEMRERQLEREKRRAQENVKEEPGKQIIFGVVVVKRKEDGTGHHSLAVLSPHPNCDCLLPVLAEILTHSSSSGLSSPPLLSSLQSSINTSFSPLPKLMTQLEFTLASLTSQPNIFARQTPLHSQPVSVSLCFSSTDTLQVSTHCSLSPEPFSYSLSLFSNPSCIPPSLSFLPSTQTPLLSLLSTLSAAFFSLLTAVLMNLRVVFLFPSSSPSSTLVSSILSFVSLFPSSLTLLSSSVFFTSSLSSSSFLDNSSFVVGVVEPAFAEREEWWDVLVDVGRGTVRWSCDQIKPAPTPLILSLQHRKTWASTALDSRLAEEVLRGVEELKGEEWASMRIRRYLQMLVQIAALTFPFFDPAEQAALVSANKVRLMQMQKSVWGKECVRREKSRRESQSIKNCDATLIVRRLTSDMHLSPNITYALLSSLSSSITTSQQSQEFLLLLPHMSNGLDSFGPFLFHRSSHIRGAALTLLSTLRQTKEGRTAVDNMNFFFQGQM
ncbi:hypothetical protein BLNAU_18083 [Blattamonas nauphoetae]|uniref:UDENN domain-containing protein n=1 Tax=Blattamonas nauphoetae TaxID=2049346 RepID=A0ABQ9X5E5_9EUKA|nr:hypothetical protein BLNAU_18083 [Blattamonas nauphoetae]